MNDPSSPSVKKSWFLSMPFLRVSRGNKILFYSCLAAMFEGGIPVSRTFELLQTQQNSRILRAVARKIREYLAAGESLADSFAKFPYLFSELELRLIAFAEKTGKLPQVFTQIAHSFQTIRGFWTTIITGLIYPALILIVAFVIIPIVKTMILGGTQSLIYLMGFYLAKVMIVLFLIWLGCKLLLKIPGVRRVVHSLILNIPFMRGIFYRLARARFAYILNTMYQAGISMLESMSFAARSCGNLAIAAKLKKAIPLVKEGKPITQALAQSRVFSPMALGLLATGEESGSLDAMLQKFGDWEQKEAEVAIERWARVIPFAIYLIVMLIMLYMIVSFYSNYYSQIMNIH